MVRLQALTFTSSTVERLGNELCKGHALVTPQTRGNSNMACKRQFPNRWQSEQDNSPRGWAQPHVAYWYWQDQAACNPSVTYQDVLSDLLVPKTFLQINLKKEGALVSARAGSHQGSDLSRRSTERKSRSLSCLRPNPIKVFHTHSSLHIKALMMNFKHHLMYPGRFTRCPWRTWFLTAHWTGLVWHYKAPGSPLHWSTHWMRQLPSKTAWTQQIQCIQSDLIKIFPKMNSLSPIPILSATF